MIEPASRLLDIFSRHGCRATFFVDAGFILRLEESARACDEARADYSAICAQLREIAACGHDIQLHVHPHWEDTSYVNGRWQMLAGRFRLHDFPPQERIDICLKYAAVLKMFARNQINAFRAGGWCLQPFSEISDALKAAGIRVDSTVFRGGYNSSSTHFFDYRAAPDKSVYRFGTDPVKMEEGGGFIELPIADIRVSPLFYWNFAFHKFLAGDKHRAFGDGQAIPNNKRQIVRLLTRPSHSVVSCDGFKSSLLQKAFRQQLKKYGNEGSFVVIGHPKAATPYSLERLENFVRENSEHDFIAISEHPAVKDD